MLVRRVAAEFPIAFGRYQLVERLAVGGMAELYLAEVKGEHGFAKKVVIKRILPHLASDPHFTQMFIAEAKITARLSHPRIAQTHRLGQEDGNLYIEMEYVDGLDVLAMLRECAHRRVRLPPEVSAYIVKDMLDGLDYAHKLTDDDGRPLCVVHRDVSPSNILVSRRGNVKLVDFGIAHAAQSEQHTQAGTLKGKYGYMSPEQVLGEGVSPQSDLFSVGVVLAEMLMGRRLFAAPNELDVLLMVRDVNLSRLERYGEHIPPGLASILRRALRKAPDERFDSAAAFRDALDEWIFESRVRVTSSMIGELVESLYADAHERRRTSLEAEPPPAEPVQSPLVAALAGEVGAVRMREPDTAPRGRSGPAASPAARSAPSPAAKPATSAAGTPAPPAAGRPGGPADQRLDLGAAGESLSEEEIELAFGALREVPSRGGPEPSPLASVGRARPGAPLAGAPRSDSPDEELSLQEEIVVDLEGLDGLGPPGIALPENEADHTVESVPGGMLADDDGIPISVEEAELSMRFPSISAAVASVSPPRRDPAARDFDDSDVSGMADVSDLRSGRRRLPTADELARAPRPAPPQLDEIVETPAQSGDLTKTPPIRILFQLVSSRADGLLVVSVGAIKKEIYIKDGIPTYVSSNMASELFGAYLVQQGAVSSGELDMALAMMPHFGGKLGDTLVGLGLMKPLDVFRMLTRQVRAKLIDVCTWNKGTYTWYPWRENHRESFPLDLDPYEVLGAGAMAMPEDVLWQWSEEHARMKPRAAERPGLRADHFKVGEAGRTLLDQLRGEQALPELIARAGSEGARLERLRLLYLFSETGLITDAG